MSEASRTKHRTTARFVLEGLEGLTLFLVVVTAWPVLGRWLRDWGSSETERTRTWAGDELVANAVEVFTRGVSVEAEPVSVWPWLVQFGLGRAGFYSYEFLERITGIPVRNVEAILPEHQALEVGDEIKLHPNAPGIRVGKIEAGRHVCFGVAPGAEGAEIPDPRRSWSIYVEPQAAGGSRLVVRSCIEALRRPTFAKRVGLALEVPVDFVMEQRMLRTIKRLAESKT